MQISGSSVAIWNDFLRGPGYDDPNYVLGEARFVRGDEWLVTTAMAAAQSEAGYARFNENVGLGQEMSVLGDAPTKHWSTLFKPQNWAFFLLPLENALAFKWWFRAALLIFAAFVLLKEVLRHEEREPELLALGGAAALFLTPFVQWWYSTSGIEALAYTSLALYGLIKVVRGEGLGLTSAHSVLTAFSATAAALTLYPPFLIPLAWLAAAMATGIALNERGRVAANLPRIGFGLALSAGLTLAALVAYYISFEDVLGTIQGTVYPGRRTLAGGSVGLWQFLGGFFNALLPGAEEVPSELENQSEASSAFYLFPWAAPAVLHFLAATHRLRGQWDWLLIALAAYLAVISAWLLVGLSSPIERLLLLDRVPAERGVIGIVMANLVLTFYFVTREGEVNRRIGYACAGIGAAAALAAHLYLGFDMHTAYPWFVGSVGNVWALAVAAALLTGLLALRRPAALVAGLLAISILVAAPVNPLYRGLDPLLESRLVDELEPLREGDEDALWAAYDTIFYGNYLFANGFHVLGSVHFYPQRELWERLDPSGADEDIWNRYAHLHLTMRPDDGRIELTNPDFDSVAVSINPCHPVLAELHVDYFVLPAPGDFACLRQVGRPVFAARPLFIYRRLP